MQAVFVRSRQLSQAVGEAGCRTGSQGHTETVPQADPQPGKGLSRREAGYRLGSDPGSPNHRSTLVAQEGEAQNPSPGGGGTQRTGPGLLAARGASESTPTPAR